MRCVCSDLSCSRKAQTSHQHHTSLWRRQSPRSLAEMVEYDGLRPLFIGEKTLSQVLTSLFPGMDSDQFKASFTRGVYAW